MGEYTELKTIFVGLIVCVFFIMGQYDAGSSESKEIKLFSSNDYKFSDYSLNSFNNKCYGLKIDNSLKCVKDFTKGIYQVSGYSSGMYSTLDEDYDKTIYFLNAGLIEYASENPTIRNNWILFDRILYDYLGYDFKKASCINSETNEEEYFLYLYDGQNNKLYILYGIEPYYFDYEKDKDYQVFDLFFGNENVSCSDIDKYRNNEGVTVIR